MITSAGTAAGIDACLHVLRIEHGAAVANADVAGLQEWALKPLLD